jgi:hypothetical protein
MKIELHEVFSVPDLAENFWKVRVLVIDEKSPAQETLTEWSKKQKTDYKKILKALRIAAKRKDCLNPNHVKRSTNPNHGGKIFEVRAHRGHARLMFFYSLKNESLIVCTNPYWKGKGNQNQAFDMCAKFQQIFENHYAL